MRLHKTSFLRPYRHYSSIRSKHAGLFHLTRKGGAAAVETALLGTSESSQGFKTDAVGLTGCSVRTGAEAAEHKKQGEQ